MKQHEVFAVKGKKEISVQVEKIPLWSKDITKDVVPKFQQIHP
jgi:hypothetical protein